MHDLLRVAILAVLLGAGVVALTAPGATPPRIASAAAPCVATLSGSHDPALAASGSASPGPAAVPCAEASASSESGYRRALRWWTSPYAAH